MKKIFKYVSLIACAFILSGCGNSNTSSVDAPIEDAPKKKLFYSYEYYQLNCPVKSLEVAAYEASSKFGEVVKGELNEEFVCEFNNLGRIERLTCYYETGEIYFLNKFVYDQRGCLSESKTYSSDGKLSELNKYECGEDGLLLKWEKYDAEGDWDESKTWECDGDKLLSYEHLEYSDLDGFPSKCECKYKYNGEVLEEIETSNTPAYSTSQCKFSKYDKYGIQEYELYIDGELNSLCYRNYNKNEELVDLYEVDYSGRTYECNRKFNENDLVIYDRIVENGEEKVTEYEYEYDQKGNWIKKIKYEGILRTPVEITEREIVYW